jgi:hypothetical protein
MALKRYKSKLLYKVFIVGTARVLYGPFSMKPYAAYSWSLNALTTRNATGWVSEKAVGYISICQNGFHGATKGSPWLNPKQTGISSKELRWYKIRLFNCYTDKPSPRRYAKWVGTHFKILKRVSQREATQKGK